MSTAEFDYDALFDGLENGDAFSNHTTSPTTVMENDSDSGIGYTPPMPAGFDNTVIDLDALDILPPNMESVFSDDFYHLFSDENNLQLSGDNTTFDDLFGNSDLPNQEIAQQTPFPIILPKPSDAPAITRYIKVQSCSNTANTQCIKVDSNPNLRIVTTPKTITFANVPPVPDKQVPVVVATTSPAKRPRAESPVSPRETTMTMEQLKLQYGHMSEEALRKHLRMIKNRESASLSRKRRKELMENLDVRVKELSDENDQLKRDNAKLSTRIQTLELENELLKKYKFNNNVVQTSQPRKPLILMGIVLLVVFNVFTLKSLAPVSTDPLNPIAVTNNERAVVPSRTILSSNADSYPISSEHDYGPSQSPVPPSYPYIQCVAYINKTHSQRINRDLHSWVQDQPEKQTNIIPDQNSLTIPATPSTIEPLHHLSRKVARQAKSQFESKSQLQPYKTSEVNYDEFIETIDRKNDTLYFVSFKRDHLILPAKEQNQTQRPKLSLILPASMANLNKSIHVPNNHVPMIKIDCEVEDTKLVFVKHTHIPLSYRNDLFQYYASEQQATI